MNSHLNERKLERRETVRSKVFNRIPTVADYRLLICLLVVFVVSNFAQHPAKTQSTNQTAMCANIEAVAREEADRKDSAIIIRPSLVRGTKYNTPWIDFELGDIAVKRLELSGDDPYRLPFAMFIHAAVLRNLFSPGIPDENVWSVHIDKIGDLACKAVAVITDSQPKENRDKKLSEIDAMYGNELRLLEKALMNYAAINKLRIGEPGVGRLNAFAEQDAFDVKIRTSPVGGRVKVVTAFVWKLCLKNNCDKTRLTWRELNIGGTEGLIGEYHYLAEWNDGRRSEGDLSIDRNHEREFRPN